MQWTGKTGADLALQCGWKCGLVLMEERPKQPRAQTVCRSSSCGCAALMTNHKARPPGVPKGAEHDMFESIFQDRVALRFIDGLPGCRGWSSSRLSGFRSKWTMFISCR